MRQVLSNSKPILVINKSRFSRVKKYGFRINVLTYSIMKKEHTSKKQVMTLMTVYFEMH